jgi:predicted amidohydrolase YtcJ
VSGVASSPDVLLIGGTVYRTPGERAHGDAVLVRDGLIAAVGPAETLRTASGAGTTIVDLRGRAVLPAFIDSHTHFHRGAVLRRLFLDFDALRPAAVSEVSRLVTERAGAIPPGAWVQGDSLSPVRLAEGRLPNRYELDAAAPRNPVVLRGIGKHVVAANTAALAAAGIDRETADPAGGRIERDETGEPTGILHETAKLRLDQSRPDTVVPQPSAEERTEALRAGFGDLHAAGIATIHEMIRLPEEAGDLAAIHAAGDLGVRVRLYYRVHESPLSLDWLVSLGIRRGFGDDWLKVLGMKVSVDGFCIFRNAAVYEPYSGEPDNLGLLRIDSDRLCELVRRANDAGLNVAVHAVGARAVDLALDAFAAAGPAISGPHRLEHGYVDMDPGRLARMRQLGLVWSTQPAFCEGYAAEWHDAFGAERTARLMPLRDGAEAGLTMLFNSDFPCVGFDPLVAIRQAVPRLLAGRRDDVAVRDARVAAWRACTTSPADVAGDSLLGRVESGALADLVIVDEDPFDGRTDLAQVVVRATMIAGALVHRSSELGG